MRKVLTLSAILLLVPLLTGPSLTPSIQVESEDVRYKAFCVSGYKEKEFFEHLVPLGDLISRGEGDWNAVNRGYAGDTPGGIQSLTGGKTFENYTVRQVMELQRTWLYAVGRYQFIPSTLRLAVRYSSVTELDMFTPETQNRLFAALVEYKRPAVGAYLRGHHDYLGWALDEMAKEWASVEYRSGRGFYDHIGGNRASITRAEVSTILQTIRAELTK